MKQVDRRIIFLILFIGVIIPLILVLALPIEITLIVEKVYDLVENTEPGSRVLISFDYDPASKPELQPMAESVIRHCFERDIKPIVVALWPMGVVLADEAFEKVLLDFPQKVYGVDYVNLGYKAGGIVTIQAMGKNFREVFPQDSGRTPINELSIMQGVNNFNNISFIFALSSGVPGMKEWVMVANDMYGLPTTGGTTAVSAPGFLPYVNEQQQLRGLLGGLKAAAEYETLIDYPGKATSGMDAQSMAHLIIIIFIILANVNYWRSKSKKNRG